ncbi:hypothetical protein A3F00_04310 [Candidatus Daviesbacteria bacterium RIFCSPHIGHO2_12_FULL_37_11]|uniref:Uncharacterized protein n=1 Tax=Candidatus Daviesbacteria bacterium RIFCSPHIGHO2_12_FULL_37_11 TaxID=1797777 RepID=A0A1F5KA11_9BACT|nr:MAG: hypothetical protein A2111_01895 [Candidatus Daviesbacteria bacterium GWA1_38_6]OGE16124.1 MAG: hypothetical protein A2769_03480 [Candidatus Daviesbacteria bacterium RIFCSPHIGHO2_01_FULL_37_27]OGE37648.1 MAG: hypothetical protein A3F00_04310 [Candidatus Daviesbacteria bacterium RIFCSPHIGHO2_12_FULL_37_11]OGE45405.1 MAG: hypothetical protein A3B39_04710 [Candidatus Daviesbacteria bacterium RIFCSPLOWO2_01_FULL_37_10]
MIESKIRSIVGGALTITSLFTLGAVSRIDASSQISQEVFITCWNVGDEALEETHLDLHVRLRNIPADLSRSWLMLEDLNTEERAYLADIPSSVTGFDYRVHQGQEGWGGYYLKPETDIRVWVYQNHDDNPGVISESILTAESCPVE